MNVFLAMLTSSERFVQVRHKFVKRCTINQVVVRTGSLHDHAAVTSVLFGRSVMRAPSKHEVLAQCWADVGPAS